LKTTNECIKCNIRFELASIDLVLTIAEKGKIPKNGRSKNKTCSSTIPKRTTHLLKQKREGIVRETRVEMYGLFKQV